MSKFWKIFLISLGSLLGLIIITVIIVMWLVFTPARVTSIANNQANKLLTGQTDIGRVELTLFKTFPRFGIEIDGITLVNPMEGAPSDTLLHAAKLRCSVDIKALLKREELIISDVVLSDGFVCVYYNEEGKANFEIYDSGSEESDSSDLGFEFIDLGSVKLNDVAVIYADDSSNMLADLQLSKALVKARVKCNGDISFDADLAVPTLRYADLGGDMETGLTGVDAKVKGTVSGSDGSIAFDGDIRSDDLVYDDRAGEMLARLNGVALKVKGSMEGEKITFDADLSPAVVWYDQAGEKLADGLNAGLQVRGEAVLGDENYFVSLEKTVLAVNSLSPLKLDGTVDMKTAGEDIDLDLNFDFADWRIADVLALVPASYFAELDGIVIDGTLTAKGNVKGLYNGSSMPAVEVDLKYTDGAIRYTDILPFPLHGVVADAYARVDMNGGSESYAQIRKLMLNTPKSYLQTSGRVGNLMGDISVALNSSLDILLDEMAPMIPDDIDIRLSGRVKGQAYTALSMSQLEKMQLDHMKLNGSLVFTDIDAEYEGVEINTRSAMLDFVLPNPHPTTEKLNFAGIELTTPLLQVKMKSEEGEIYADFDSPKFTVEAANIMNEGDDIQPLLCDLTMRSAQVKIGDDMYAFISNPDAGVMLSPSEGDASKYSIELSYKGGSHTVAMNGTKAQFNSASLTLTSVYDSTGDNIISQFSPYGTLLVQNVEVDMDSFEESVYIPAIEIAVEPTTLVVKQLKGVFGGSDFELVGYADNLDGFFADSSPLKGHFNLTSDRIDILNLMNSTSGMGTDEAPTAEQRQEANENQELAGPFIVPANVELAVFASVKEGLFGESIISNINGMITVSDGVLVIGQLFGDYNNNLTMSIPGADLQITGMYKTEYRDHIYFGVDIHFLNIQLAQLLRVVPMVDTYLPVLRYMDGRGEFHAAVEFYTDSQYNTKMSTVRGAASISGQDLEVVPAELYKKISRMLLFSKKTRNVINEFSAELTVFKDEVDVYPFEISLDKYKVIVSGRHSVSGKMPYNYDVSVVKSPLPFRLAVNVTGDDDDFKVRLRRNKMPKNFRPVQRGEVSQKQMELRELIRNSLKIKVATPPTQIEMPAMDSLGLR